MYQLSFPFYMPDKPKPVYVLFPGYVISVNDGDKHYITANMLINLYNISYSYDLIFITENNRKGYKKLPHYIELHPDPTGEYKLPEN